MKSSACILILDSNRVLAVSRKDDPNDFGLPGGKMEMTDRCLRETARRECQEETGIYALPMEELFTAEAGGFQCTTFMGLPIHQGGGALNESGVLAWVRWVDLFEGTFGEYNRALFESLNERLKI